MVLKPLNKILKCSHQTMISGIKTDSREVVEGDLYIASKGFFVDHSNYIGEAIKNGAKAVVTDIDYQDNIPIVKRKDLEKALVNACINFFDYQNNINLIGITGTDGKTTTASILSELLNDKDNTAYMGTNGIRYKNQVTKMNNTTPPPEKMYAYLSNLEKNGCENCVLEVSSESLLHKRVSSFRFQYVIYTNITEDHLNIHKNINNYIKAKMSLTSLLEKDGIIISNGDDVIQERLQKIKKNKVITYGKSSQCDFKILNIIEKENKTYFDLKKGNEVYHIESPYLGEYNVYNLTACFIVCYLEKMNIPKIIKKIKRLGNILGRGEVLNFSEDYKIVLDYAHTYHSIESLIECFKKKAEKLIVVTGAAGGREKEKRPKIGKLLLENCDLVIFTMDDPRFESVDSIIDDMLKESNNKNYLRIVDREKAIKKAFSIAKNKDYVLIIGKGRDSYMAIEDRYEDYSDYEVIQSYFLKGE